MPMIKLPIKPSTDLFGLALTTPLCFPKNIPPKYPPVSLTALITKLSITRRPPFFISLRLTSEEKQNGIISPANMAAVTTAKLSSPFLP